VTIELGQYGVWDRDPVLTPELAREVEELGFGAIWIGGSPDGDLVFAESLLDATERIVVATGIVNMWKTPAQEAAASYHRVAARHPDRFLLGVGIGHPEATSEYRSPYSTMVDYLDVLDEAGVPVAARVLAALGPKALALAAERTAGPHPYLVPTEHTKAARAQIGDGVLLAPEQKIIVEPDPARARTSARPHVSFYFGLRNYASSLRRLGWADEDLAGEGSDRLVDALVGHGDADAVAARLTAHLDAGADHVSAQVVGDDTLATLRAVSEALNLR
jgi:probable F420-dependent oxidoreductase